MISSYTLTARWSNYVKSQSHICDARPAHWKCSNFGPCVVVTRSSSALDQRYAFVIVRFVRLDFCACTDMCAEVDSWMYTKLMPRARWINVRHTRMTRWVCVFVGCGLAHTERTHVVLVKHVQRSCSACGRAERVSRAPSVLLANTKRNRGSPTSAGPRGTGTSGYKAETSTSCIPGNFILKANSATTSDTTTTLLAITE